MPTNRPGHHDDHQRQHARRNRSRAASGACAGTPSGEWVSTSDEEARANSPGARRRSIAPAPTRRSPLAMASVDMDGEFFGVGGAPDSGTAPGPSAAPSTNWRTNGSVDARTSSGRALRDDAAFGHEVEVVDDLQRFVDVVRDHHRRDSQRVVQLPGSAGPTTPSEIGIEPGERLVVEHEHRVERDRARQRHAARHAARQFGGPQLRRRRAARRR